MKKSNENKMTDRSPKKLKEYECNALHINKSADYFKILLFSDEIEQDQVFLYGSRGERNYRGNECLISIKNFRGKSNYFKN